MILGALIDCGIPLQHVIGELEKINFSGYKIAESMTTRKSLSARRIEITLKEPKNKVSVHSHKNHSYKSDHHTHEGFRTWKEVRELLKDSRLPDSTKEKSLRAFELLAEAEAKAHGVARADVHFHEVGATDSLVDMIGTCIAVDFLQPDKIISTPVAVGSGGFVDCSHGRMPVPTPATLNILSGKPIRPQPVEMELCTPTGAALLVGLAESFEDLPKDIRILKTGLGAGSREGAGDLPGVFRAILAEY